MRTDYLNEVMNDIRQHNADTRSYQTKVRDRLKHITAVRDKLNAEIDRLEKLDQFLGQLAAENGAETFNRPSSQVQSKPSGDESSALKKAMKNVDDELGSALEQNLKTGT